VMNVLKGTHFISHTLQWRQYCLPYDTVQHLRRLQSPWQSQHHWNVADSTHWVGWSLGYLLPVYSLTKVPEFQLVLECSLQFKNLCCSQFIYIGHNNVQLGQAVPVRNWSITPHRCTGDSAGLAPDYILHTDEWSATCHQPPPIPQHCPHN
jgi:hypothetical protein